MYKWNPEDYRQNSTSQERAAEALISKLELEGNEHILDIGCGDGKVTARLASRVPHGWVLGIDSSQDMIDFSQKRFSSPQYANLRFELGDATRLDFDEEFDLVISFSCLHWVKDHLTVLKDVKRSLKPGGRLLFLCGGKGTVDDLADSAREVITGDKWRRYFRDFSNPYGIYSPEEYHAWLEQTGLEELRAELTIDDIVLPGREGVEGFLRTTWLPITERIPEDLRTQFVGEISERHLEKRPLQEGMARIGAGVLLVEARKPF